jgi:Na+/melibiose symporter-like transporter
MRNRVALLVALGIDNAGSGLFLPLALVYATRVVGLPLGLAGALVSAGTLAGLAVPAFAGRLVDRAGPRLVVVASQVLQALGAAAYLLAHSSAGVVVAAVLLAAGQQAFYSSLFALISDVAGSGPHERPFTVANMVRAACFGLGGLAAAGILTTAGLGGLRLGVAADGASFIVCAVLLSALVRPPRHHAARHPGGCRARHRILADKPFLLLIVSTGLLNLTYELFLVGTPVYALEILHTPRWVPGTLLAIETALTSAAGTAVLRATRRMKRLTALRVAAWLCILWAAASVLAILVPGGWRPVVLILAQPVLASSVLVISARQIALAEAMAPPQSRGRYLASLQYAFTVTGVLAPAVVALYSAAAWLPWVVTAGCAGAAIAGYGLLADRLPPATYLSGPGQSIGDSPAPA